MKKTEDLLQDFIKVWLGDLPEGERRDAIYALQNIIESVTEDVKEIAKRIFRETVKEPTE